MGKTPLSPEGHAASSQRIEPLAHARRTPEEDMHAVYPTQHAEQKSAPIEDGATWDNHNTD